MHVSLVTLIITISSLVAKQSSTPEKPRCLLEALLGSESDAQTLHVDLKADFEYGCANTTTMDSFYLSFPFNARDDSIHYTRYMTSPSLKDGIIFKFRKGGGNVGDTDSDQNDPNISGHPSFTAEYRGETKHLVKQRKGDSNANQPYWEKRFPCDHKEACINPEKMIPL